MVEEPEVGGGTWYMMALHQRITTITINFIAGGFEDVCSPSVDQLPKEGPDH